MIGRKLVAVAAIARGTPFADAVAEEAPLPDCECIVDCSRAGRRGSWRLQQVLCCCRFGRGCDVPAELGSGKLRRKPRGAAGVGSRDDPRRAPRGCAAALVMGFSVLW